MFGLRAKFITAQFSEINHRVIPPKPFLQKQESASAEVLLETVLVFVTLVVLAIGSIRLFSFLNTNIVDRIAKYQSREARLGALEGDTPVRPEAYLDDAAALNLTDYTDKGDTIVSFLEEPRLQEAEILLAKQGKINDLILRYKLNQASFLANGLTLHQGFCKREVFTDEFCDYGGCPTRCVDWYPPYWEPNTPQDYISLTSALLDESINLINQADDNFSQAITKQKDVLDNPIKPGPYDFEEKHQANREDLAESIDALEQSKPFLDKNILINGNSDYDFLGLNYILEYIDVYECRRNNMSTYWDLFNRVNSCPDERFCRPSMSDVDYNDFYLGGEDPNGGHKRAKQELGKLISNMSLEVKGSPFLETSFINDLSSANSLLQGEISQSYAESAYALTERMLGYTQVKENSSLKDTVSSLKDYLGLAIEEWKKKEPIEEWKKHYLELSKVEVWALNEVAEVHL